MFWQLEVLLLNIKFSQYNIYLCLHTNGSISGHTLRRGSAASRLLWFRIRIPPAAWVSVPCECCVLSGRGLCVGLITRPEESYRVWCVWVWSWSLSNEEALAHWGLSCRGKKKDMYILTHPHTYTRTYIYIYIYTHTHTYSYILFVTGARIVPCPYRSQRRWAFPEGGTYSSHICLCLVLRLKIHKAIYFHYPIYIHGVVKVKLSMHMWWSRILKRDGIAPICLNLDITWRWVIGFTFWQIYLQGKTPIRGSFPEGKLVVPKSLAPPHVEPFSCNFPARSSVS